MKWIPLTKGKEALVDDEEYEYLMQWKWHAAKSGRYAARARADSDGPGPHLIYMHLVVAARSGLSGVIDHRNRQPLDNRRKNLRSATQKRNVQNSRMHRDNIAGFKGVSQAKRPGWWRARIWTGNREESLGEYYGEVGKIEAARAYNEAALKYFGEFAHVNPV